MARIAGVDLPNKHVDIALTYIYGIGRSSALKIARQLASIPISASTISPTKRSVSFAKSLKTTTRSKAVSELKLRSISSAYGISAVIEACVTAKASLCADSEQGPMRARARVRERPLRIRRKPSNGGSYTWLRLRQLPKQRKEKRKRASMKERSIFRQPSITQL